MAEPAQNCAPAEYQLIDVCQALSLGGFDTLDDARAAARLEGLEAWEIWHGNRRIEQHEPMAPDQPLIASDSDVLDRLGEALRRYRHGLMRPLWADMTEADKDGWRNLAATFVMDLKKVSIRIEVER